MERLSNDMRQDDIAFIEKCSSYFVFSRVNDGGAVNWLFPICILIQEMFPVGQYGWQD
jgi:hypothetical protein